MNSKVAFPLSYYGIWMPPPPTPGGVENVKNQENSEKIRGPPGALRDPLQPF